MKKTLILFLLILILTGSFSYLFYTPPQQIQKSPADTEPIIYLNEETMQTLLSASPVLLKIKTSSAAASPQSKQSVHFQKEELFSSQKKQPTFVSIGKCAPNPYAPDYLSRRLTGADKTDGRNKTYMPCGIIQTKIPFPFMQ